MAERIADPMERMIARALQDAGLAFTDETRNKGRPASEDDVTLDFHLTDFDVYIEVKQFHTDRVGKQMAQAENVIVAQGARATAFLAAAIRALRDRTDGGT